MSRNACCGAIAALALACACSSADPGSRAPAAAREASAAAARSSQASAEQPPAARAGAAPSPSGPAASSGPHLYGAPLDPSTPELSLARLLAAPAEHAGKVVRTRGTIARVCRRMGCWMELQGDGAPTAVRIPMADHAYFLPQDVVGRRAEIQGKVSIAALGEAHKRHLQEEGAHATDVDVSIAATGVSVQ